MPPIKMLNKEYLLQVLPELSEFGEITDMENHVKTGGGYDEVTAILENIRTVEFPVVVIEDRSSGNFTIEESTVDTFTIALWVIVHNTRDEEQDTSDLYKEAFGILKKIVGMLLRDQVQRPEELGSLDISRMPYNRRMGGPNCLGYELLLTFKEDIELAL